MSKQLFDLLIIGGGINGAGIAADAAGRGLKVALFEQNDFASATSSASSKLIHGGLRYLEHYEFRLVREALQERETLLSKAPHLVEPMRFRLPHRPHLRPWWMIRSGLFLYDNLAKRGQLEGCQGLRFGPSSPLKPNITRGFEYSDCWVDDARMVVANIQQAAEKGALVGNYQQVISARRENGVWQVEVKDRRNGKSSYYQSKALVNAAGPWVQSFIESTIREVPPRTIRLVKGSHIVVPKIHDESQAYILQNADKRIVFAIPYQQDYTLIGTTDVEYQGDPSKVAISDDEVRYLCDIVNQHFEQSVSPSDVVHSFSGVRPLCQDESNDPSAVTRDYTLELSPEVDGAPLLSVFGGKLTTYRKLAEAALKMLQASFPDMGPEWTASHTLPGGDITGTRDEYIRASAQHHNQQPSDILERWIKHYGSRAELLLSQAKGQHFGGSLYQSEVDYLIDNEWAVSAEDILWRRTKQGLYLNEQQVSQLEDYLQGKLGAASSLERAS